MQTTNFIEIENLIVMNFAIREDRGMNLIMIQYKYKVSGEFTQNMTYSYLDLSHHVVVANLRYSWNVQNTSWEKNLAHLSMVWKNNFFSWELKLLVNVYALYIRVGKSASLLFQKRKHEQRLIIHTSHNASTFSSHWNLIFAIFLDILQPGVNITTYNGKPFGRNK